MKIKDIGSDLLIAEGEPRVPNERRKREWAPLFCPRKFVSADELIRLENYQLTTA